MSTRGVKFLFSVGEFVLCFEPDPTKARVLYDAKILDTTSTRDLSGTKIPAYHVHFLGWNNSWDRIVPETYVLRNTEEYRELMKKLADTTKKYRINSARNRRIDRILKKAFRGKPPLFEDDGDSPYEDDDYISSESEEEKTDVDEMDDREGTDSVEQTQNGSVQETENQSTKSSEDGGSNCSRSEDKKRKVNVDIELPPLLKEELEKDFIAINRQNMVLNLPAQPNIISILEEFVKSFCVNVLFSHSAKSGVQNKEGSTFVPVERNIPLCKEMVDGLRLCFDYTLPLVLLYASEKGQLERLVTNQKHKSPGNTRATYSSSLAKKSPVKRKHSLRTNPTLSSNGNLSPKIPKLSPEIFKDKMEFEVVEQGEFASRRLTRQSLLDSAKKVIDSKQTPSEHSVGSEEIDKEDHKTDSIRKKETRSSSRSHRHSSSHPSCSTTAVKNEPPDSGVEAHSSRDHEDAPPPLLIPSAISKQKSLDNGSQDSKGSSGTSSESCKEDILDRILSWQLLPAEKLQANLTAPSLLYGAHHLLRLFVKLPDLITSMNMEDHKVKALLSLIQCFLDYLMERREELFKESLYIQNDD